MPVFHAQINLNTQLLSCPPDRTAAIMMMVEEVEAEMGSDNQSHPFQRGHSRSIGQHRYYLKEPEEQTLDVPIPSVSPRAALRKLPGGALPSRSLSLDRPNKIGMNNYLYTEREELSRNDPTSIECEKKDFSYRPETMTTTTMTNSSFYEQMTSDDIGSDDDADERDVMDSVRFIKREKAFNRSLRTFHENFQVMQPTNDKYIAHIERLTLRNQNRISASLSTSTESFTAVDTREAGSSMSPRLIEENERTIYYPSHSVVPNPSVPSDDETGSTEPQDSLGSDVYSTKFDENPYESQPQMVKQYSYPTLPSYDEAVSESSVEHITPVLPKASRNPSGWSREEFLFPEIPSSPAKFRIEDLKPASKMMPPIFTGEAAVLYDIIRGKNSNFPSNRGDAKYFRTSTENLNPNSIQRRLMKDSLLQSLIQSVQDREKNLQQYREQANKSMSTRESETSNRHQHQAQALEQEQRAQLKQLRKTLETWTKDRIKLARSHCTRSKIQSNHSDLPNSTVNLLFRLSQDEVTREAVDQAAFEGLLSLNEKMRENQQETLSKRIKRFKDYASTAVHIKNGIFFEERKVQRHNVIGRLLMIDRISALRCEALEESNREGLSEIEGNQKTRIEEKQRMKEQKIKMKVLSQENPKLDTVAMEEQHRQTNEAIYSQHQAELMQEYEEAQQKLKDSIIAEKAAISEDQQRLKYDCARSAVDYEVQFVDQFTMQMRQRLRELRTQMRYALNEDFEKLMITLEVHLEEVTLKTESRKRDLINLYNFNHATLIRSHFEANDKKFTENLSSSLEMKEELRKHEARIIQLQWENAQQLRLLKKINTLETNFVTNIQKQTERKQEEEVSIIKFYFQEEQDLEDFFFHLMTEQTEISNAEKTEAESRMNDLMGVPFTIQKTDLHKAHELRLEHQRVQSEALEKVLEEMRRRSKEHLEILQQALNDLHESQVRAERNLQSHGKQILRQSTNNFVQIWSSSPSMQEHIRKSITIQKVL
ncbi:early endosome antigen 1-like [Planoprotostelium fungivorum]|uniref:Early endosome antigen 1-like n=1 Tax=Planoprotostelium fungivorum TaxID=1890364 RepID=A0A2P6NQJ6_9EUKA|nr:early endosome antigen 1-like [Planoprotostelium fungivorum]